MTKARVLMCPPVHFNVDYEINPWMQGNLGAVSHDLALRQWEQLREVLAREARIELVAPRAGLPDMVDRKSTRLNSSHIPLSRMPSSA